MKKLIFLGFVICAMGLSACQDEDNKIVSTAAQEPDTAMDQQNPARLDTAMKSSEESASAVAQDSAEAVTGMKEATASADAQAKTAINKQVATGAAMAQGATQASSDTSTAAKSSMEQKMKEPAATSEAKETPAVEKQASSESAMPAGDATRGEQMAKKRCSMCHNFDSTKRKVGPGLQGVYGRAPSIQGVPFAKWDAAALDKWLTKPRAVKKNTKMAFPGFPNPQDRADVIAFLKTL